MMTAPILDFWHHAEQFPDSISLVDDRGTAWSAKALSEEANRVAHGLRALGATRGDVIAVLLPRCAELIAAYLATSQIGLYLLTLNPRLSARELLYIIADSGARIVLIHPFAAPERTVSAIVEGSKVICVGIGNVPGCRTYAQVFGNQSTAFPDHRTAGRLLPYTSGTTGHPKAVLRGLSDKDPGEDVRPLTQWFRDTFSIRTDTQGTHLCACPLHYGAPLSFASYALHLGQRLVLMPAWNARLALQLIEMWAVTTAFMVPYQFISLLKLPIPVRQRYSTASLQVVIHGSAPCPVDVKKAMLDWWGDVLFECYGSTEVGGTVATPAEWRMYPGTVGRMANPHDLRICDEQGNELPPGREGTIFLRAHPGNNFIYKGDLAKTRACRRGDFITVGDVGYMNEAGYLFLLDRRSDLITCRGEHIYPAQLESTLAAHPLVADCAVYGIPHPEWGEEIRVAVVLEPGIQPDPAVRADLLNHMNLGSLTASAEAALEFVDQVPRDESGKLRRRELRERATSACFRHESL